MKLPGVCYLEDSWHYRERIGAARDLSIAEGTRRQIIRKKVRAFARGTFTRARYHERRLVRAALNYERPSDKE